MSWEEVAISDFCRTGSGGTPSRSKASRYYGGSIPWVKSGELREESVYKTEEYVTGDALKESAIKLVPPGALLIAMYGATVGRMATLKIEATTNQAVCHIIPDEKKADTSYLNYALQNKVPYLLKKRVGGGQPNISQQIIKDTKIPLPPLPEQRRIAAILDKADAIRRKRQQAIRLTEEFLRSVFLDMFGDPVLNPKGWEVVSLGEIGLVQGGLQVTSKRAGNPIEVPYLRVANVYRDRLDLNEIKKIQITKAELERIRLQRGDMLMVEGHGNPSEIGRSAIWDGSIDDCVHQNHLIRVRVDKKYAYPEYVSIYLNSPGGRRQLFRHGKTTSGLNTISTSNVKSTSIVLPPLKVQEQFLDVVRSVKVNARKMDLSLGKQKYLFNSLVQRAFRGEL